MFTMLVGGLCAIVLENPNDPIEVRVPVVNFPAVAIGVVGRDTCRVGLVLAEGQATPLIPVAGHLYSFRVEEISETAATLIVDGRQAFSIPRAHSF